MPTHARVRPTQRDELAARPSYRPELQGLRAVAILMVVCYHIWFGRVSGGVDIFLLISSFLLTGSFARKLERGRPLRVPRYWLHAFKRLVPPAAVTILLTVAASLILLPASRWREILRQGFASLGYYENIYLAQNSVDYYAQDHSAASPLQHFWSLSVQGQVFFLWPLLFALGALLVRRFRLPVRATLLVLFGAVFAGSLAWSIYFTAADQTYAYFDTRTRLWEFALGSLLALVLPAIEQRVGYRVPGDPDVNGGRGARVILGWAGLALILSAGFVLDVQGSFPGWIALWPTLAALLVIAAGPTHTRFGVDRLLSARPLLWLGDISYALYLVHWPLLVITLAVTESAHSSFWLGALLVGCSIVLAWLLTRLVDAPIRYSAWLDARPWRSGIAITASAALVIGGVGTTAGVLNHQAAAAEALAEVNNPGARTLDAGFIFEGDAAAVPLPQAADLGEDWFSPERHCRGRLKPADAEVNGSCAMEGSPSAKTLVVIGNSRTQQYAPSILGTARAHGWTVVTLLRGGCAFGFSDEFYADCNSFNSAVIDYLRDVRPDAVLFTTSFVTLDFAEELTPGARTIVHELTGLGIDVIGYRDGPRLPVDPVPCVDAGENCTADVQYIFQPEDPSLTLESAAATTADATGATAPGRLLHVDIVDLICPGRVCSTEIGNVFVWMDQTHISATYAATMSGGVDAQLSEQGWGW